MKTLIKAYKPLDISFLKDAGKKISSLGFSKAVFLSSFKEEEAFKLSGLQVGTYKEGLEEKKTCLVDFGDLNEEQIEKANGSKLFRISLICPSGINREDGCADGLYFKSQLNLVNGSLFPALYLNDSLDAIKENVILNPEEEKGSDLFLSEEEDFKSLLPYRRRNLNKGSLGKTAYIGGCASYYGAPYLSYLAGTALDLGGGYAYLGVPDINASSYALINPQLIMKPFKTEKGLMALDEDYLSSLLSFASIGIGMGLGVSKGGYDSICYLLSNYKGKLVIDADGLNCLAAYGLEPIKHPSCEVILTPHLGEFGRLIKKDVKEVIKDEIKLAREFTLSYPVVLLLKSASSLICEKGKITVSPFGNSGLAKAGSGDLLSGILTGLGLYDLTGYKRAGLGAYVLGAASQKAAQVYPEAALTYDDIVSGIKKTVSFIQKEE